jgi:hypothetical protein
MPLSEESRLPLHTVAFAFREALSTDMMNLNDPLDSMGALCPLWPIVNELEDYCTFPLASSFSEKRETPKRGEKFELTILTRRVAIVQQWNSEFFSV